jgi:hypothetical protein
MVSRLATQLIRLPHPESAASDMLWRYATLTDVVRCRTAVSKDLAAELAMFLDGQSARSFARLLPSAALVQTAFETNPSAAIREGIVENPLTGDDVLAAIAAKGPGSQKALDRLTRRQPFTTAVTTGTDLDPHVESLVTSGDAAPFVSLASNDRDRLAKLLASMSDLALRSVILDAIEQPAADPVLHALVGVLDPTFRAGVVDDRLAEWLCGSDSLAAHASRELVTTDREAATELLGRLDDDARRRLADHDTLWSVVQRRMRAAAPVNPGPARPLDRGMLSSMRLAGMGVAEISALIFNSRIELSPDELANELQGIDAVRLAGYLTGGNARHPRPGEIDALVAMLDQFEQHRLAEALTGDIDQYPWCDELLVGIPRRFIGVTDPRQLEVIDTLLGDELGNHDKAWEVVLSMSEEWEGNLRSLVVAARQL